MCKVRNDLGLEIMKDICHFVKKPYNLRNDSILQLSLWFNFFQGKKIAECTLEQKAYLPLAPKNEN